VERQDDTGEKSPCFPQLINACSQKLLKNKAIARKIGVEWI
jgi:hypothetical protein